MTILLQILTELGYSAEDRSGIIVATRDGHEEVLGDVDEAWAWAMNKRAVAA